MKDFDPILSGVLWPAGKGAQGGGEVGIFFGHKQREETAKGGPVSRRSADTHKLIRYQRNGIARLSRAVRQG